MNRSHAFVTYPCMQIMNILHIVPGPGVVYALHEDEGQGARAPSRQYILDTDRYISVTFKDVLCFELSPFEMHNTYPCGESRP